MNMKSATLCSLDNCVVYDVRGPCLPTIVKNILYLFFLHKFGKLESNTTFDWLNRMV